MVRALSAVVAAALVLGAGAGRAPARAQAANPIRAENARAGTNAWQVNGTANAALYAGEITAAPGDAIQVHVSTAWRYRVVVYRIGWYGGAGARLMACVPGCSADEQGAARPTPPAGEEPIRTDWPVTDVVHTGRDWVTGYYLVESVLANGPDAGHAAATFFILRPPASAATTDILVQVPVNTWEAYNEWGGKSLYEVGTIPRARAVSFDRPFDHLAQSPMWWEIQLVRFLEREGYDVGYQTDLDTDGDPASLLRHQLVIVAGHDEYWTGTIRTAFDTALAHGTNLAFTGSNDGYWQVRYEDGDRTIFSYKSLYDPNPVLGQKTAMFREVGRPECMLMAVQHSWFGLLDHLLNYTVTAAGAADPWLKGTGLHAGDTIAGVVGREHDQINPYPVSCYKPGLVDLFHYDGGGVDQNGDAVRWTAPSGARVFASGAQQFTWALDDWRDDGSFFPPLPVSPWQGVPVDPRIQQFVRNVLDDLTRPAPPSHLTGRLVRGVVRVRVARWLDPRVTGFVAAVRRGPGGWHRFCAGTTGCDARAPRGKGRLEIGAVAVDRWARTSTGAFAIVQR